MTSGKFVHIFEGTASTSARASNNRPYVRTCEVGTSKRVRAVLALR